MNEHMPLDAVGLMIQSQEGCCQDGPGFQGLQLCQAGWVSLEAKKLQGAWRQGLYSLLKCKVCGGGGRANEADVGLEPRARPRAAEKSVCSR